MKIIITGSLGNISKPLAITLIQQGHAVTVVSSKSNKKHDIEAIGATAAIGSMEDVAFLTASFIGADAVYCMVPPNNYFDQSLDLLAYYRRLGKNYAKAILNFEIALTKEITTLPDEKEVRKQLEKVKKRQ